jgi:hypothetical protein
MKRLALVAVIIATTGCGGGAETSSSDLTLTIADRQVLINNGFADDMVDWIVIRSYALDNADAAASDDRVRFEAENAFVTLPDGTTEELRGSRLLFYLDDEGVEAHPIHLRKEDLDILHTQPHESVRAMIDALADLSMGHQYD